MNIISYIVILGIQNKNESAKCRNIQGRVYNTLSCWLRLNVSGASVCTLSIKLCEPGVGDTSSVRNLKCEKALLNIYISFKTVYHI